MDECLPRLHENHMGDIVEGLGGGCTTVAAADHDHYRGHDPPSRVRPQKAIHINHVMVT
ncbi:hypothetical protein SLNWT_0152 [Streptomyces albus]|uniref:Uncharacterized protein n=1 Tax=Streptomyces albus (strain ATCC 21838 / DSM 41398 / FERM P-419 / JCM 4703 / NBRC 107858) TaxID=1081613 RepID=A0A0B5EEX7_STRA4|nr:hypothetical protein SLNWT_0152 [Streptomyces albus]AOU74846.1 hypothetical protein SLNHY_0155 [Streptomyces albus]AYN30655.1 hypothetical protein DUI70_0152 [Streptomyces albus]